VAKKANDSKEKRSDGSGTPELSEQEIERRRDDAIRRALNTPPKPHKAMIGKSAPPPRREPRGAKKGR
jgi:hypothetical protein